MTNYFEKLRKLYFQISSGHAATIPPIPEMLKTMEVRQSPGDDQPVAIIPMAELIDEFTDGYLKQTTTFGRTEYLFAKDVSCIERFELFDYN